MTSATVDNALDVLKTRLKATWMDGNYDYFSRFMASSAPQFLDPLALSPGTTLLDVACGSGQVALVAAERGLKVTGVDIATNLVLAARARAAAAGVDVQFDEGDAEALPYPDATFDVVASLFGAMFAPRPNCSASAVPVASSSSATGRRRGSSARCSRPLRGF
jgi:2-polyprenyl-3-methyl-5-hydroxy-6-metoxy-1,4-benzoquinol methylase